MEADEPEPITAFKHEPPNFITLSPFSPVVSPSPRRLSSCYAKPSRPIRAARQLAWVSLQGRLVGAEEATSTRAITRENGLVLKPEEIISWEMFTPIHRVLLVAIIAVAAANSKRNKEILKLKKAVEIRDQILMGMQEKLDNLCEQISYFKDQPEAIYECQFCLKQKYRTSHVEGSSIKTSNGDEMLKFKLAPTCDAEPEERRMSDLSDWAPSTVSSIDLQLNSSTLDQDIYNLRRECEEKDATIRELSTFMHSSEVFGSKRIGELEDIIRRKNMIISKLKKDMMVLETKVINLTRARRPSFSTGKSNERQLPAMADNLLFYMDSSSPSSSDSDSSSRNQAEVPSARSQQIPFHSGQSSSREVKQMGQNRNSNHLVKPTIGTRTPETLTPLREKSLNLKSNVDANSKRTVTLSSHEHGRARRRALSRLPKDANAQKRWV